MTATIGNRENRKHFRRRNSVDGYADCRLETAIHFEQAIGKSSVAKDSNTFVEATRSIGTQAVDWRQRITSNERLASRGLHYHASTQNWPMIADGRSDSYNDRVRIRNSDIQNQPNFVGFPNQKQAEQTHAPKGSIVRAWSVLLLTTRPG